MWLMSFITKNSITQPNAVKGSVNSSSDGLTVMSSGEHKKLKLCQPYGITSIPPVGEKAVVLPLADGEIGLGVIKNVDKKLEEGEIMLASKGGASIVLKNDGRVLINGEEVI